MMKLIGAERSFIRGPFVVEAIMYGFIAAVIATAGVMDCWRLPRSRCVNGCQLTRYFRI